MLVRKVGRESLGRVSGLVIESGSRVKSDGVETAFLEQAGQALGCTVDVSIGIVVF